MSKFNFIFLILFLFTACVSSDKPGSAAICAGTNFDNQIEEPGGNFDVLEVESEVNVIDQGAEGVLDSDFVLKFRACVTDSSIQEGMVLLKGADFKIYTFDFLAQSKKETKENELGIFSTQIPDDKKERNITYIKARTNADGCLIWSENYKFREPSEKQWIYFERVFENNIGGKVVVPMVVNPWMSPEYGTKKFYDVRYNDWVHKGERSFHPFKLHQAPLSFKREKPSSLFGFLQKKDPNEQIKKDLKIEECVQRRSLTEIFSKLETHTKKPLLWSDSIRLKSLYTNISRPHLYAPAEQRNSYYDKYKICSEDNSSTAENKDCEPVGSFLTIGMDIPLEVISKNHLNRLSGEPVDRGEFLVTPYLTAHTENDQYIMLHRPLKPITARISSAKEPLKIPEFIVHIPYESSTASIEMIIKVEEKPQPLSGAGSAPHTRPFYGVFTIAGETNSIHGNTRDVPLKSIEGVWPQASAADPLEERIKRVENFKSHFQSLVEDGYAKLKAQGKPGFSKAKLALKLERMRYVRLEASEAAECESVVERTVLYMGEVCLTDQRRTINFREQPITVTVEDLKITNTHSGRLTIEEGVQEKAEVVVNNHSTDQRGCIQFLYRLRHKPYDTQKYFVKRLIFTSNQYGYRDDKIVILNPWEYGFLTFQDATQFIDRLNLEKEADAMPGQGLLTLSSEERDVLSLASSEMLDPPIIRLNDFRSILIEPSYLIERSLDITTVKNIILLLQPSIYRSDAVAQTIRAEPLPFPKGHWILRTIIAKGPQEKQTGKAEIIKPGLSFSAPLQSMAESFQRMMNPVSGISGLDNFYKSNLMYRRLKTCGSQAYDSLDSQRTVFQNCINTVKNSANFFETTEQSLDEIPLQESCFGPNCDQGFSEEDYITHYDTVAYSENGVLSAFINQKFNVEYFRYLGSKNSIIFQIYPTDPEGYKYKRNKRGKKTCDLDVLKSKFTPYSEENHDLVSPAHWGLFQSSEFGNLNIVRPIDEKLITPLTERIGSIEHGEIQAPISKDIDTLRTNTAVLNQFGKTLSSKKDRYTAEAGEIIQRIKSRWDSYCPAPSELAMERGQINPLQKLDTSIDSSWFKLCVCDGSEEADEWDTAQVKNCLIKRDFINSYEKVLTETKESSLAGQKVSAGRHTAENKKYLNNLSKKLFCEKLKNKFSALSYEESPDYSPHGRRYLQCVCDDSSKRTLAGALAQCFSSSQGLKLVDLEYDSSSFMNHLNEGVLRHQSFVKNQPFSENDSPPVHWMDEDTPAIDNFYYMDYHKTVESKALHIKEKVKNLPQLSPLSFEDVNDMIESGVSKQNMNERTIGSFMHLMCHFWFGRYYKNYLNDEDIKNFYAQKRLSFERWNWLQSTDPSLRGEKWQKLSSQFFMAEKYQSLPEPLTQYISHFDKTHESFEGHPLARCLKNPLYFFHVERKVMAGDLSLEPKDLKYNNGHVYIANVGASEAKEARLDWALRRSFSTEASGEVGIGFDALVKGGAKTGARQSISNDRGESDASRRSFFTSRAVTLAINHIEVQAAFSRYKRCLLVRPKGSAFSGADEMWNDPLDQLSFEDEESLAFKRWPYELSGLLVCGREKTPSNSTPLKVDENYYYIHQFFGGHAYEFMSRTIYHNRPYTQILRGAESIDRLLYFVKAEFHPNSSDSEDYTLLSRPAKLLALERNIHEPVKKSFEQTRLDWSGFYEGVYTYSDMNTHYLTNVRPVLTDPQDESLWTKIGDTVNSWVRDITKMNN